MTIGCRGAIELEKPEADDRAVGLDVGHLPLRDAEITQRSPREGTRSRKEVVARHRTRSRPIEAQVEEV